MVVITSFVQPESPVKLEQRNVLVLLDKQPLGRGTLFVSERTLSWQKEGNSGFSIDYYNVSLHATTRDPNVYHQECIYILTDSRIEMQAVRQEDEDESDDEPDLSELILVPEDASQIQNIYESIKLCQELNPDPADVEDDDDLYADAEEGMQIIEGESGDSVMDNLANRLQNNTVDIQYNYSNGNNDDDEFQDAD